MPLLLGLVGVLAAILFWVLRVHGTVKGLQAVDRDTKGLQRRAVSTFEDIVGTPLQRVRDPRLAVTILMIQIVRTGSPLTASEKTWILEFMETPLKIERISATFERAWGYTQARLPFSLVSDQLTPLCRETLTLAERTELIAMLTQVAGAHSAPSALQRAGIARLRRKLLAGETRALDTRRDGSA
ncbi:TerB family tellurite resistance protein [Methylobacterium sp. J-030]|uniref:TerB family tellurite resistance protein n=1 Tax=Methylobacterium sp. J-030 TaxID=2836627 RepID=UPI001FBA4E55|nr:TerB family tellurite resistance protein [Methylobacterium sp. J-030]MCJ2073687.1 TerB family tellurite resistance protein [Methylobacterium sp. J-030]